MYFKTVRAVLDSSLESYCKSTGADLEAVYTQIAAHIRTTSSEHRNPDPNINYDDPLCRSGYLYMHTAANATLFERTLRKCSELGALIRERKGEQIRICAVGGGPGTELLGLAKYLLDRRYLPAVWDFTLLDRVPHWGETWSLIAEQCELHIDQKFEEDKPRIHRSFYPMDVTDPGSYEPYAWLFRKTDIFVFNYIWSENQGRMAEMGKALAALVDKAREGAYFVIIDRLEYRTKFVEKLAAAVNATGLSLIWEHKFGGRLSNDEQSSDLGEYGKHFGRNPRVKFFGGREARVPTVVAGVYCKTSS